MICAKEIYVDASGNGRIAVVNGEVITKKYISNEIPINYLETMAILLAIELYGEQNTIFSDNKFAIKRVKELYPNVDIQWIRGTSNIADRHTKSDTYNSFLRQKKKQKNQELKKDKIMEKYPYVKVGDTWMTKRKYSIYRKWMARQHKKAL